LGVTKEAIMTRVRVSRILLAVAVLGVVWSGAAAEESTDKAGPPVIRVSGESTISAKPDQAEINLGVVTQAETGEVAAAQNARKQDAVLAGLKQALGSGAEIKTISYSLTPNYRYPKEGGQPAISGYTASNVILAKTGELSQVGKAIDAAIKAGANNVQSLRFTLKDETAVRAQALKEAAVKARAKADALASALGLKIARVLLVDEGGQQVRPVYAEMGRMEMKAANAPPTPIEAGSVEIEASVSLTVEIAH
jgi:uncharacterized protein